MTDQLALDVPLPAHSVTDETAAILRLMDGDPIHAADRRRIVEAIVWTARTSLGTVDPNKVRARLSLPGGELVVYPRLMGAVYRQLACAGVLERAGYITNEDSHGRNAGKPTPKYRLVRKAVAA